MESIRVVLQGIHLPDNLRYDVWKRVLSPEDQDDDKALADAVRHCPRDLPNQRVIRVDVERTRVDLTEFRQERVQEFLTQQLTYFCRSRRARYKQGLNEILAPFVYLSRWCAGGDGSPAALCKEGSEAVVFKMWVGFVDHFVPHLYDDDVPVEVKNPNIVEVLAIGARVVERPPPEEMIALQCAFRFFELLLMYHDPELWHFLDHNRLKPELYASPWLMTLFAQNVPMSQVFQLWESMMLAPNGGEPLLIPFVALAFLCSNRNTYLASDPSDLPVLLTSKLSYHRRARGNSSSHGSSGSSSSNFFSSGFTKDDSLVLLSETLKHSLVTAKELQANTPGAFLRDFRETVYCKSKPPTFLKLVRLSARLCPTMTAEAFWADLMAGSKSASRVAQSPRPEIVVVDCRLRREFEAKRARARLVFNFGVEILENPDRLGVAIADLRRHLFGGGDSPVASNVPPSLGKLWKWQICVVGLSCRALVDGKDEEDTCNPDLDGVTGMCVLHLLKHAFPCISIVEGGWSRVIATCPDVDRLCFPPPPTPSDESDDMANTTSGKTHVAYRRPRASYGDAVDDFDGPSFIVSRSSRGAPVKF